MTLYKGILFASEKEIKKAFNVPEDFAITSVSHDSRGNEFEFVVYSSEFFEGVTEDTEEVGTTQRKKLDFNESQEEIVIDDEEMVGYILEESNKLGNDISKKDIETILDLEIDFLKVKGVIE